MGTQPERPTISLSAHIMGAGSASLPGANQEAGRNLEQHHASRRARGRIAARCPARLGAAPRQPLARLTPASCSPPSLVASRRIPLDVCFTCVMLIAGGTNPMKKKSESVRMSTAARSLAVNDVHNHALRLGHGVARCGASLECYRCGASCTVNDVDGKPVTIGTLHEKACRK